MTKTNTPTENNIKITIREVADTLGWNYDDAVKVSQRKSPKDRYQLYTECKQRLIQAKEELQNQFKQQ